IALKVEPGDQMDIEAWVKYRKKTSYTRSGITAAMASILGSSYTGTASGLDVLANATQTFQNGLVAATGAHGNGNDAGSLPYAYVYYLLYDRSFNFTTAGWKRVTTEGGFDTGSESLATHGHLSIPGLTFTEPGYIYIFVSNESENTEVWFDDLHVDHKRSTIVAGADYYPFGLPMENREITREDYRYGYQGQYSEEEKETCWNSFELRMYDARIGRWLTVDPYGQFASPYVAMGNVPYSGADFDGGYFSMFGWKGAVIGAVAGVGISFAVGDQDHWYLYALGSATAGSFLASDFAKVKVWGTHRGLGNADALYGGGRENIARINHMDLKYNGKLFTGENLGKITPIVVKAAIQVQSVINQEDTKPTIDPTRSFPPSTEGVSLVDGDVKTGVGEGTPSPPKIASGTDVLQDIADYLRRSGKKVEVTNVNTRFIFKKVGMNGDKQTVLFSMRPHMYKRLLFIHNTLINMGAPEGSVITTRTKFNYWKNNSGVGFRFVD
ncbi:MAG TPA: RHS repeat-associated core domain-containing protein, partial [Cyclobacteriaceae bacterium]